MSCEIPPLTSTDPAGPGWLSYCSLTGCVLLLITLILVTLISRRSVHILNNFAHRIEWEYDTWERSVTFDTLRSAGFDEEVTFLQSEVIGPFINRDIYAITGTKRVHGLLFHGDLANAIRFATAIWNEMRLQGESGEVTIFRKTKCTLDPSGEAETNYLDWLFKVGVENQPAIIYLNKVNTLLDGWSGYTISKHLHQSMEKVRFDGVLVIASVPHLEDKYNYTERAGFSNVLHIPKLLSLPERREVLAGCVSTWIRKPKPDILDVMANKTGVFLRGKFDIEEKIGNVCQFAYKNGVEEWKKKRGVTGDGLKIRMEEVNPSLQNWEDALATILKNDENQKIE
ncbi:uncharacterized protein LOC118436758 [Folsomia candida]|uniref:Uncharacterized protein n=1 Tax=Folsomia candida TaxID=158441 RepID=A0A226DXN6_FOLCA|nr:uncharacterized protein LOC118436758 [Folsomia candida]OXA49554.1 hypothetical protein Fcan01_15952 [Folsomia candida]